MIGNFHTNFSKISINDICPTWCWIDSLTVEISFEFLYAFVTINKCFHFIPENISGREKSCEDCYWLINLSVYCWWNKNCFHSRFEITWRCEDRCILWTTGDFFSTISELPRGALWEIYHSIFPIFEAI